jgi:hypothetical protein
MSAQVHGVGQQPQPPADAGLDAMDAPLDVGVERVSARHTGTAVAIHGDLRRGRKAHAKDGAPRAPRRPSGP